MIAIDLDGTLLLPDGTVSERNKAAIQKTLAAGLLVCFATGRNLTESQTILDAVAHYDTAVLVGGAMVVDTKAGTTLHRMGMDAQLAREVCQIIESLGYAALALQDTNQAGVDYLASASVDLNEATRQWMVTTTATIRRIDGLAGYDHVHTIRVGLVAKADEVAEVQRILRKQFGDRILCQCLHVPAYGVEVLEVFDPAVNKWQGVLQVAAMHGVSPHQIVAIGDDINDLPMISQAGLGVAMGNAKPEVRAAAKRIIGSNHEDGLAAFLEELVDKHLVEPENRTE